jgi:hypothetical protein
MAPLRSVSSGLPGPGQEIFTEAAKESGRHVGLEEDAALILEFVSEDDGGGDVNETWKPQSERVRGRIDPVGTRGSAQMFGEQIDESTTHIIYLDPNAEVSSRDRIEIEGTVWTIVSAHFVTDGVTKALQVKELRT